MNRNQAEAPISSYAKALWGTALVNLKRKSQVTATVAPIVGQHPAAVPQGQQAVTSGQNIQQARQVTQPTVPTQNPSQGGGSGAQGGGGSSQPTWYRFMLVLAALITGTGSVYVALNDTPPLRAENEKIFLLNQGRESDVAIEKEKTKQVQANPALAPNQPKTSERQGVTPIGNEGQHLLATGMQFIFSGNGGDSPDAIIAIKQAPTSYSGAFKMFSKGKTSWSPSWSEDQPPYPLSQLLEESKSSEGNVQWMQLFSNGKTQFNM